jgi:hypothetical protein
MPKEYGWSRIRIIIRLLLGVQTLTTDQKTWTPNYNFIYIQHVKNSIQN